MKKNQELLDAIAQGAHPLRGIPDDYNLLLEKIGAARIVLIGEASHGTHEFYQTRAIITQKLIKEKGFNAVAIEGDWPSAYPVNTFVRSKNPTKPHKALEEFKRFPTWMWRNTVMIDFISWLRDYNLKAPEDYETAIPSGVHFIGLDLYSLHRSMQAVIDYLKEIDPIAAEKARERYSCFDHFGTDPQAYGYWASLEPQRSCKAQVISQLVELQRHALRYTGSHVTSLDEYFNAEQNALLVKNAEHYYRSIFYGDVKSWNVRDHHMMDTLKSLEKHLEEQGRHAKIVVWAHNSHLGDARATEMSTRGELNLGQLVREHYDNESYLIGFTTHSGTVSAATDWGGDVERKRVLPALEGSYEDLFHHTKLPHFLLFTDDPSLPDEWRLKERLERAIGVIYRPQTERISHYFYALMPQQFDAVIHIDKTQALEPLDVTSEWITGELPDTYPTGE